MNSQREQMIRIAFVESRTSGVVKSLSLDWVKLSERLSRCDVGDKDGPGWMPADIEPGSRTAERVKSVSALVFDCEAKAETVDGVKKVVGAEPPTLDGMLAEVGRSGWRCILHTSYNHTAEHSRYRLTFALAQPLLPEEVKPLGLYVAAILGIADCIDTGCLEPARLFYLPRCAADRKDLFRHAETKGVALPVDELLAEAAQIDTAQKSAPRRTGQFGNVIEAFNNAHDVGAILEKQGYAKHGKGRWLWPGSTTGLAGVRLLPDANPQRVFSSHGGDPLSDGHAHDAFDIFKILQHGGDVSAAVKDAAQICGIAKTELQLGTERATSDPEGLLSEISRLARLNSLEYEQVRTAEAERIGMRVGVLDKEIAAARQSNQQEGGKSAMFPAVEPWPEAVDGAVLLNELLATIQKFIVCERDTAVAASLWCAFTWLVDRVQVAPLVIITAPEKRCGKSQLLNLIGKVSRRPLVASNISPAAVFRVIEAHSPTLLIDEADSFFKENEELRGVINSGHTRQSSYVIRTVGDDHEPKQFSTWGAKAISGIGQVAETIVDRSIVLELRRKLPTESVQRLRHSAPQLFERLASKLARFAEDAGAAIERARPNLPEVLNDRAQDNWEPLLAIADHAGGGWPDAARRAALRLSGAGQEALSLSTELLADIRDAFTRKPVDRITTEDLLKALTSDDTKPWATYSRGQPMNPRQLAKRLAEYGIKPSTKRIDGQPAKGYSRADFDDVFRRYLFTLADTSGVSVTPLQAAESSMFSSTSSVTDSIACDGIENPSVTPNLLITKGCYAVTDKTRGTVGNTVEGEV